MAKNKISEYSATAGSNTDINNIDIAEGCSPSGINNAIRELMADLKDWQAGNVSGQALAVISGGTGSENAAGARTNLEVAKSGANTDITSLGGLTTPISVTQGGTGYVSQRTITAVGRNATTSTVTISTGTVSHGFVVNDIVTITAVDNPSVNGTFTITAVPSVTSFQYTQAGSEYPNTLDSGTIVSSSFLTAPNLSGIVSVSHGGTGAATLKANNLLVGNGTSAVSVIPAGSTGNVLTSSQTSLVNAGSFVVGTEYTIASLGTPTATDFMAIGAASNTVGVVFTATGAGAGSGTATTNTWTSAANNKLTSATVNAGGTNPFPSSGGPTFVDFTSIPSWVKRITVMFSGVSTSGTADLLLQIGGGSVETTGYSGWTKRFASSTFSTPSTVTTGVTLVTDAAATYTYGGVITINNLSGNSWVITGVINTITNDDMCMPVGLKSTSSALDRVRITTAGTDTFDAGSINIMYE